MGDSAAGLPGISDGQLLFLQHMISKMHQDGNQTRIAIVFNGSPLFNGDAQEGESEYAGGYLKMIGWRQSSGYLISSSIIRVYSLISGFSPTRKMMHGKVK